MEPKTVELAAAVDQVLPGLVLAIGPWVVDGASLGAQINATICGLAIAALAMPRGRITERYGGWTDYIK